MAQLLIRDLTPGAVETLKKIAKRHNRSLEAEIRQVLEDLAARHAKREEFWQFADESRRLNGPQTSDSVDLIREDRER